MEVRRAVRSGLSPHPRHFSGSAAAPVADVPGWVSRCSGCCGGDGPAVVGQQAWQQLWLISPWGVAVGATPASSPCPAPCKAIREDLG